MRASGPLVWTWGHGDRWGMGTYAGHGDMGTWGHGDMGTRGAWGHGDYGGMGTPVTSRPLPWGARHPMGHGHTAPPPAPLF